MADAPGGADLIELAREVLRASVIPRLEGDARYQALMVVNAMAIVARELRAPGGTTFGSGLDALSSPIRAGAHDADAQTYAEIVAVTVRAAGIWRPDALGS